MENTFPDPNEEIAMADAAFETVTGGDKATNKQIKVITRGTCQMQSKLKLIIRLVLPGYFGFSDRKTPLENRNLYNTLITSNAYIHDISKKVWGGSNKGLLPVTFLLMEILDWHAGKYLHALGFDACKMMWFTTHDADSFHYTDIFGPCLLMQCITLIFTTVRCGLDEWATGVHELVEYVKPVYGPIYEKLLGDLKKIADEGKAGKACIQSIGEEYWVTASAKYLATAAPEVTLMSEEISEVIEYAKVHAQRLKAQQVANVEADAQNAAY
ncbi:hypothetical protein BOTBODRAFT_174504 [Botryobasidium botryosum FD-172 SS1]|uniref:DUF6532 domain-containing protein n=1 Tax=Botryobasidium botryosum (strain FD-172 SS1) TaxID=930990 RepID=A0A067MIS2_BOTB1|nr:hypothetical protein BOTBODRAFT_174504 [Botryobasidium botryosum FD-172 SS1]